MPWNPIWPIGNVSVRTNRPTGNQNTTYIETTMGNAVVGTNLAATTDHFWNVDANLDGHHRFVKLAPFTVGGVPTNPSFNDTFVRNVIYAKLKTATESTFQQDVQPYSINATQAMQLLGIRAMGVFNGGVATPIQANVVYSHNLNTQGGAPAGIVRDSLGVYTVTFANALPSANYLILGGAIRNIAAGALTSQQLLAFYIENNTSLATIKTTAQFKFFLKDAAFALRDPLQCWFVVFGG